MNVAVSRLRSRLGITLVVLAAAIAAAVLLNHSAPPSVADQNPNNTLCKGHIDKGKADPDDPDSGTVSYTFACSQPITGYSVMPDKPATAFETEVFGTDPATKEVLATDAFSCNGEQPGWGVNCTGANVGSWHPITSTFTIDGDVCKEPRVDPLLVVTYASVTRRQGHAVHRRSVRPRPPARLPEVRAQRQDPHPGRHHRVHDRPGRADRADRLTQSLVSPRAPELFRGPRSFSNPPRRVADMPAGSCAVAQDSSTSACSAPRGGSDVHAKLATPAIVAALGLLTLGTVPSLAATTVRTDPGGALLTGPTTLRNTTSDTAVLTTSAGTLTCAQASFDADLTANVSSSIIGGSLTALTLASCTDTLPTVNIEECALHAPTFPQVRLTSTAGGGDFTVIDPTIRCKLVSQNIACYYTLEPLTGFLSNVPSTLTFATPPSRRSRPLVTRSVPPMCGNGGLFNVTFTHIV